MSADNEMFGTSLTHEEAQKLREREIEVAAHAIREAMRLRAEGEP